MDVGDAKRADAAEPLAVEQRAVHLQAAEGIGAVEDDDLDVALKAGLHRVAHDNVERVGAHTDVLQINHERVEAGELGLGGLAVGAVQGIDGQAGASVHRVGDVGAGLVGAVDAVLGAEERDEPDVWRAAEDINRALAAPVHAGGMCEQADALADDGVETLRLQHINAEHHRKDCGLRRRHCRARGPHWHGRLCRTGRRGAGGRATAGDAEQEGTRQHKGAERE